MDAVVAAEEFALAEAAGGSGGKGGLLGCLGKMFG